MRCSSFIKYILVLTFIYTNIISAQIANDLIPKNEAFFIQSALNYGKNSGGYWDIKGGEENIKEGAEILTWELTDEKKDRRYIIEQSPAKGYVKIHIEGVAGYIDVKGSPDNNGSHIQIYKPVGTPDQNFQFIYLGNGKFKIFNQNGKLITLAGRSSKNGSNVQIWDDHNGDWTEWYLISASTKKTLLLEDKIAPQKGDDLAGISPFYIQSAISYGKKAAGFWDAPGKGEPKHGQNLQVWEVDFEPDRLFTLVNSMSSFGFYNITPASNPRIAVSVQNNGTAPGTALLFSNRGIEPGQNFFFKHIGGGRFKIFTETGQAVCLPRNSDNGVKVHLWGDHEGEWMEWYLIEESTNQPFNPVEDGIAGLQDIRVANVSGESENQLISNIDAAYTRLLQIESKTSEVNGKVNKANHTIGTAYSLTNNFAKLNADVNGTYDAISAFSNLPYIGVAVKVLSTSLNIAKSQLNGANTALAAMKEPVIGQANQNVQGSKKTMITFTAALNKLKRSFSAAKIKLSQSQNKQAAGELFNKLNMKFADIKASLDKADQNLAQMGNACGSVNKLDQPVGKVDGGVRNFEKSFRQTDKIADEINDVLNKRFKKEIAKVKIDISLRDVLEGGKVGKVFKKYASDWADDLLKPLVKKLNIKIPTVPGVDEFKNSLNESADLTKKLQQNNTELEVILQQLIDADAEITGALNTLG